jgi:hypothetical protein
MEGNTVMKMKNSVGFEPTSKQKTNFLLFTVRKQFKKAQPKNSKKKKLNSKSDLLAVKT